MPNGELLPIGDVISEDAERLSKVLGRAPVPPVPIGNGDGLPSDARMPLELLS